MNESDVIYTCGQVQSGTTYAEARVDSSIESGYWYIQGYHAYWNWDYDYIEDGESWSDWIIAPSMQNLPTGEDTEYVEQIYGDMAGGFFHLILTPSSGQWDGATVSESLGQFTDECYNKWGPGGYHAGQPNPQSATVTGGGRYGDQLAVGLAWVQFYELHSQDIGACTWHGSQTMTYSGASGSAQYAWNYMEIYVDGYGYGATRGYASDYWAGPF